MRSQAYYNTREKLFNDRFPLSIVAILAIIQMLTTFAIVGLEAGHIVISPRLTNLFAGFWTSIPFTILWISMFATVCCCRQRSCAANAVVQNCISFLFASALIGINIAFLRQPYTCFLTQRICDNLSWTYEINLSYECLNSNTVDCNNTRIALIKGQLAAGALMAVTCFMYLITYGVVSSRVSRAEKQQIFSASEGAMGPAYPVPVTSVVNYQHQPYMSSPHGYQSSAPVMMSAYPQYPPVNNNGNYPNMYPQIPSDRF